MSVDRREFLGSLGAGAAATFMLNSVPLPGARSQVEAASLGPSEIGPLTGEARRLKALQLRIDAAQLAYNRPLPDHTANGDEELYPNRIGNFSKGLPHNILGEVDRTAYDALLGALASGRQSDFEAIPMAGPRKLVNPQAGLAFDLEGPDAAQMALPPVPRLASAQAAGEAAELYWMALLRPINFTQFDNDRRVAEAADDLSRLSNFGGPKQGGRVTPATIFRGLTPGDLAGPYVSQFLLKDAPFGSLLINQRQETTRPVAYLTGFDDWLRIQNGGAAGPPEIDPRRRYIRTMQDLTHYVHIDALYEAYFNACLILMSLGTPLDRGNPYNDSRTQIGFGTFGRPHLLTLVTEVATRALKCVWFQKWYVHRQLRPEEYGGRVHHVMTGAVRTPIHSDLLNSLALSRTWSAYGSYLLPQAFPEGCPTHPSYGSGHGTVAGACVTILKAWFDENSVIQNPVVSNEDGQQLVPYNGRDRDALTVGGELNKLASNIASGRNMAGIHWRTDFIQSLKLGESIAIGILEEQKATYNEVASFTFTKFDGTTITV
jgi:hypothetical protein